MHLPPPAPNQMVLVKVKKGKVVGYSWKRYLGSWKALYSFPVFKRKIKRKEIITPLSR
jgi:hypothetical protein